MRVAIDCSVVEILKICQMVTGNFFICQTQSCTVYPAYTQILHTTASFWRITSMVSFWRQDGVLAVPHTVNS